MKTLPFGMTLDRIKQAAATAGRPIHARTPADLFDEIEVIERNAESTCTCVDTVCAVCREIARRNGEPGTRGLS